MTKERPDEIKMKEMEAYNEETCVEINEIDKIVYRCYVQQSKTQIPAITNVKCPGLIDSRK
jgi:hypothetical protein